MSLPPFRSINKLESELNMPFRGGRPHQRTGYAVGSSRPVKDVAIAVAYLRGRKVGMVHDVKDLHAELDVEILRDAFYAVVLEHGEVQIGDARTDQDIATCIASEVEALREHGGDRRWVWIRWGGGRLEARGGLVTGWVSEGQVRGRRDKKGLGFDGVCW